VTTTREERERSEWLRLADDFQVLATQCRAKAEEYGRAVVAALVAGSTNYRVDLHNTRMELCLHSDANTYQTWANSFDHPFFRGMADFRVPQPVPQQRAGE
jgi:hypothetical protein